MSPIVNAWLGILFLLLGIASTFLMYHIWSYPYDQETQKGTAPERLVNTHRLVGVLYLALYIYFMVQMVPRLWSYQIEFPARTVAHLILGMSIGTILFIKLAIVRYFRHVGAVLVPVLGTMLLICTFLLIGLSVPFALLGSYLHANTTPLALSDPESMERVQTLLMDVSFGDDVDVETLTSPAALLVGERVLFDSCVRCHDLRTVLARPRTAKNWWTTVQRMAGRAALVDPLSMEEQERVTAYLVAISPQLQESRRQELQQDAQHAASKQAVAKATSTSETKFDPAIAKAVFESKCSQCHELNYLDDVELKNDADVKLLVSRMVEEGLDATTDELSQIIGHLEGRINQ